MSTAHDSLTQVVDAILANLNELIKMPEKEELRAIADKFYEYSYPNTIGAIDGTSIEIRVPDEHRVDYYTRKHVTAVNLTALCDSEKRFRYIIVGFSARCHDSHILNCSSLSKEIQSGNLIPPQYHIIGGCY